MSKFFFRHSEPNGAQKVKFSLGLRELKSCKDIVDDSVSTLSRITRGLRVPYPVSVHGFIQPQLIGLNSLLESAPSSAFCLILISICFPRTSK